MSITRSLLMLMTPFLLALLLAPTGARASQELSIRGRSFVGPDGRAVLLRGVNVTADAKVWPFLPFAADAKSDVSKLDPLPGWGINVIRLLFIWEAYEPEPGVFNEAYLNQVTALADAAWARGMYVVIDMHQDGFSRHYGQGCGAGFPAWAVPLRFRRARQPQVLTPCTPLWAVGAAFSTAMHGSFHDFYADANGARSEFIRVWARLAKRFKDHPGIIGYDLLNEPWGKERSELDKLYDDAARAILAEDPTALLFVEPQVFLTAFGILDTHLAKPAFPNVVYSPHFYDPIAVAVRGWSGILKPVAHNAYALMARRAREWNVPLFVGEFGAVGSIRGAARFIDYQYSLLDGDLASGAQWNYTPAWTPARKDGWNGEDLSIVDDHGRLRPNFRPRPGARRVFGTPLRQVERPGYFEFRWSAPAGNGETEFYFPTEMLTSLSHWSVRTSGQDLSCRPGAAPNRFVCESSTAGEKSLTLAKE